MKEYFSIVLFSIAANFGVKPGQYISDEDLEEMELDYVEADDVADYYYHLSKDLTIEIQGKNYYMNVAIAIIIGLATLSACLINIAWEVL